MIVPVTHNRSPLHVRLPETDARRGPRHLTVLMVARVRSDGGEYACVVKDVSRRGLKARFPHAPVIGDRLAFSLRGQPEVAATVRWVDGLCGGVEFDEPLDVVAVLDQRDTAQPPRAPRFACGQPATLALADDNHAIELIDVSLGGAKLGNAGSLPAIAPGTWATLTLPASTDLRAGTICWSRGPQIGFRFAFSLPLDMLAAILARGGR